MLTRKTKPKAPPRDQWTLITNHGGVLLYVAHNPHTTVREAALAMNLSQRTVLRILADLSATGYIQIQKTGRRNLYGIFPDLGMRRPEMHRIPIQRFVALFADAERNGAERPPAIRS